MKIIKTTLLAMSVVALSQTAMAAKTGATLATVDPEADRLALQEFMKNRFPNTPMADYINGIYAVDAASREQWEAIEEFPPYDLDLEEGEELFNATFANGKSLADCFDNGGEGVRQNYPLWNDERKTVVTLEMAINECRLTNGEEAWGWKKGKIAKVSAYMAYTSRGNTFDIQIPNDDAKAAYLDGKKFFYTKRGQLNLSCADCHLTGTNRLIRADLPSPALGQTTHFPTFRSKWEELGTLHRRYEGCHNDSRSEPLKAQSNTYRNLEYFQTYMSNGLVVNGPGARK
jgi:sulfur-oxidizing protein SoxA